MKLPEHIRTEVFEMIWAKADEVGWLHLDSSEKSRLYSYWTEAEAIGGRLGGYMDPRQVRVYLKDTVLKSYSIERMSDPTMARRVLRIEDGAIATEIYTKPHGQKLDDGRIIAWSNASDWKLTLFAVFERAYPSPGSVPFGVVLIPNTGKFRTLEDRRLVEEAGRRLGIQNIVWLD
ncbi:hypothetical protein [Ruegeria arenilitoris]|uniref:hypothetical protein n=1 Tax=Ruegeria arenilitoris TaxID=1173585 RepID=UPI001479EA9F|nr:hypothetical protein [Ruegeria arenilitoris]